MYWKSIIRIEISEAIGIEDWKLTKVERSSNNSLCTVQSTILISFQALSMTPVEQNHYKKEKGKLRKYCESGLFKANKNNWGFLVILGPQKCLSWIFNESFFWVFTRLYKLCLRQNFKHLGQPIWFLAANMQPTQKQKNCPDIYLNND